MSGNTGNLTELFSILKVEKAQTILFIYTGGGPHQTQLLECTTSTAVSIYHLRV